MEWQLIIENTPRAIASGRELALWIGVPSIDREHDELVAQLDSLTSNPHARPDGEVFSRILGRLGEQISAHFESEEGVLRSIGMPADEILEHVLAHDKILEEYTQLNIDLMQGEVLVRSDVLAAVRSWIIGHILTHDIKIRQYLPKD